MAKAGMSGVISRYVAAIHGGLRLTEGRTPATIEPLQPSAADAARRKDPITELPLPNQLAIPLVSYGWQEQTPLVRAGQSIALGDPLAESILAPAAGRIERIGTVPLAHPGGLTAAAVILDVDPQTQSPSASCGEITALTLERLRDAGVQGLGGAGFPLAEKLDGRIHTLVINAVECEPYISCDDALLQSDPGECVSGVADLIALTGASRCLIAIENTEPATLAALDAAVAQRFDTASALETNPEIVILPDVYPAGAEGPLLERLLSIDLAGHERPLDRGVAVINIGTARAAGLARKGLPMIDRVVTIGGPAATHPGNYRVRFGTSLRSLLAMSGNPVAAVCLRVGGPLSGVPIDNLDVPLTASSNCVLITAANTANMGEATTGRPGAESPCIRCAACSDHCPAGLFPQELLRFARSRQWAVTERLGLDRCLTCGVCDLVCPSHIRLTDTFRHARSELSRERSRQQAAQLAVKRQQLRDRRLAGKVAERATQASWSARDGMEDADRPARPRRRKPNPRRRSH